MSEPLPEVDDDAQIAALVAHYREHQHVFGRLVESLRVVFSESPDLKPHVHSMRWRVKDADHLATKMARKAAEARKAGNAFDITVDNLFERVNDLAGFRVLHLHTSQFPLINNVLLALLDEHRYVVVEGPVARTWDEEYKTYFRQIPIDTVTSPRMYTSVHYVIEANTKTKYTAEIQVRTLAEELWGGG